MSASAPTDAPRSPYPITPSSGAITGNQIAEFDDKSPEESPVEFALGTGRLLSLGKDGTVRLRDGHSGALIAELAAGGDVERVTFASDGRRVLMALKASVRVLDPDTGTINTIIPADERVDWIGSFSPDRRRILTRSPQYHAHVWDLESGQMLRELAGYPEGAWIDGNEFSKDGRLLLVSTALGTWIWDVDENRIIASLRTQVSSRRRMAGSTIQFSLDGRRILEPRSDQVDVWNVATGKRVASLKHKGTILGASWDRVSQRIVTASRDRTARIWPVPDTQALIDGARNDVPRCLTRQERDRAFLDLAPPAWCIEAAKWPYRSPDWKQWLAFQRRDPSVPLPGTKAWDTWRAHHDAPVQ